MKTEGMKYSLLLEFYACLLTERQAELVDLYYNDDLSLSEISELTGITRQGVRDGIKKSEVMLCSYEEKLGMYALYLRRQEELKALRAKLDHLALKYGVDKEDADLAELVKLLEGMQQ